MSAFGAIRPVLVPGLAALLLVPTSASTPSMPTLPTPERVIEGDAFSFEPIDDQVAIHAGPDGRVVVLAVEDRVLHTLLSEDGAGFAPGPIVTGSLDERPVFGSVSEIDAAGAVHVVVVDGRDGGYGLSYARGDGVGRTWTAPVSVLGPGDASFPVSSGLAGREALRLATGTDGRVAIGWRGRDDDYRVAVSSDNGATWTAPTRVDRDVEFFEPGGLDLAFTSSGTLVYVYSKAAPPFPQQVSTLVVVTSDDLGTSFSEPALLEPDPFLGATIPHPVVEAASDGSVSVFGAGVRYLSYSPVAVAYRSIDDGRSFGLAYEDLRPNEGWFDFVHADIDHDGAALFVYQDGRRGYSTVRSSDHGASWGGPVTLPGGFLASNFGDWFDSTRLDDGGWLLGVETTRFPTDYRVIEADGDGWSDAVSVVPDGTATSPVSFDRNGGVAALPDGTVIASFRASDPFVSYEADVYAARRDPVSAGWEAGVRIDDDGTPLRSASASFRTASDGERLHVFNWTNDQVVAQWSDDGGRSYSPPFLVASEAAAFFNAGDARATIGDDGTVHVAWIEYDNPTFTYPLRYARSSDGGATWTEPRVVLDDAGGRLTDEMRLMPGTGGEAYLAWIESRGRTLRLARIESDGTTATDLSPPDTTLTLMLEFDACRTGEHLLFLENEGNSGPRLFGRSYDLATGELSERFEVQVNGLTPDGMQLACTDDGSAVAAWIERSNSNRFEGTVFARRMSGTAAIDDPVELDSGVRSDSLYLSDPVGVDGVAVASYSKSIFGEARLEEYAHWLARTDGASTPIRIDLGSSTPQDLDFGVDFAADDSGRVWVAWVESPFDGGGETWVLTSRSEDAGRTWGAVRRVSTVRPERVYEDVGPIVHAVPGGAAYVWRGQRASDLAQLLTNVDRVNAAPIADAGPDQRLECEGDLAATATLDGSGSTDPDGADDLASWAWTVDGDVVAEGAVASATFPLGSTEVTLTVADRAGATGTDAATIIVEDSIAPAGGIAFPGDGTCHPGDVTIETNFSDACDPDLGIAFDPPGPTFVEHGDHTVTATATDAVGNGASDTVTFTIDRIAPAVTVLVDDLRWLLPSGRPLASVFASGDDDGAGDGVVHEALELAGCRIYDGATYGDADGLLSDETVVLDLAEVCRLAARCGWTSLESPEFAAEATDCAGNVGRDARVLPGSLALLPGACGN